MVEDDELVFDRHVGGRQLRNGGNDAARREIAAAVVVAADDQDAGMRASGLADEIVEFFKVIVICGQECAISANRLSEVNRIRPSD
jgi:hypothetical protein